MFSRLKRSKFIHSPLWKLQVFFVELIIKSSYGGGSVYLKSCFTLKVIYFADVADGTPKMPLFSVFMFETHPIFDYFYVIWWSEGWISWFIICFYVKFSQQYNSCRQRSPILTWFLTWFQYLECLLSCPAIILWIPSKCFIVSSLPCNWKCKFASQMLPIKQKVLAFIHCKHY